MFIGNGALNLALYGCEVANVIEQALGALTTAIAMAVGPYTHRACNNITFSILTDRQEVEPFAVIFLRRCTLLRRMLAKRRHLVRIAEDFFSHISRCQVCRNGLI